MSDSPLSPSEIRAAAEAHEELGPEYSDAVVAAFLDKVDRAVAARADARLGELRPPAAPAEPEDRRTLLKGIAIGISLSGIALLLVGGDPAERVHRIIVVLMIAAVVCTIGATWERRQRRARQRSAYPTALPGSDQRPF